MTDGAVHQAAAVGFERSADAYERGRPSFGTDIVGLLSSALDLGPDARVLELGPGTGKLTRLLVPTGAAIVGVEPVDAMRRTLRKEVPPTLVVGGVAEALPFRDGAFTAAVAAQVFHWLDGARAVPELARAVVPGSSIALVWNVRDEDHAWVGALTRLIEPFRGSAPSHRSGRWREAFDATAAFTPLELHMSTFTHATTRDGVVDRIMSISFIAALPDAERAEIRHGVMDILAGEGATDAEAPVAFPYRTEVWLTSRR